MFIFLFFKECWGRNSGFPQSLMHIPCWKLHMLSAREFSRYSQCCFLNPTCISLHFGWIFISDCTLQTAYRSQKDWVEQKYAMETENVNCSFSCPPRANIQISGLFGLGLSVQIFRHKNKYSISRNKCWGRVFGQTLWGGGCRQASIFVLTSANLFLGITGIRDSPRTDQTREHSCVFRDLTHFYILPS